MTFGATAPAPISYPISMAEFRSKQREFDGTRSRWYVRKMNTRNSREEVLLWAENDGVDLSMLRERLRLSPTERLRRHEGALALVEAMRNSKESRARASGRASINRPVRS
jgi:hypothetical protein